MRPEETIEQAFITKAFAEGYLALKLTVPGWTGWPDRLVLGANNTHLFLEFKQPGEDAQPHQTNTHTILEELGHDVFVVDSVEEALELCRARLQAHRPS